MADFNIDLEEVRRAIHPDTRNDNKNSNNRSDILEALDNMPHEEVLSYINFEESNDFTGSIPSFDAFLELANPIGNLKKAGTNNLYGINHRQFKEAVPENRDVYGLTFFTRPQLNLMGNNIRRNRKFYPLLNTNPVSVHRYVRGMLDPRLGQMLNWEFKNEDALTEEVFRKYGNTWGDWAKELAAMTFRQNITDCPLVDPHLGFIPILTNNLLSLTGWPDISMESYTSEQGHRREQWIMVDSPYEYLEAFDLTAAFRNTRDEPILLMFQIWELYMSQVFEGMVMPYLDFVTNNEIDYNTRIYRFVLDETKTFIKKCAACGAAFPTSVPTGKMFDFSDEATYNLSNKEIDITFKCVGADYNDYVTLNEFNYVSAIFSPDMRAMMRGEEHNLVKIPRGLLTLLNHRGYPYVNMYTLELEWWISRNSKDLNRILRYIKPNLPNRKNYWYNR